MVDRSSAISQPTLTADCTCQTGKTCGIRSSTDSPGQRIAIKGGQAEGALLPFMDCGKFALWRHGTLREIVGGDSR
jgi:hypothetical protein